MFKNFLFNYKATIYEYTIQVCTDSVDYKLSKL